MKIQAREIVRYARKNGITLTRFAMGYNNQACVVSTLSHMVHGHFYARWLSDFAGKVPISEEDLNSLESGFEGWNMENRSYGSVNNRYYKVGQNVAKLAGLPPK